MRRLVLRSVPVGSFSAKRDIVADFAACGCMAALCRHREGRNNAWHNNAPLRGTNIGRHAEVQPQRSQVHDPPPYLCKQVEASCQPKRRLIWVEQIGPEPADLTRVQLLWLRLEQRHASDHAGRAQQFFDDPVMAAVAIIVEQDRGWPGDVYQGRQKAAYPETAVDQNQIRR